MIASMSYEKMQTCHEPRFPLTPDAVEIAKLQGRNEYHPDGKLKVSAMYRNEIPEGISIEYKPDGTILFK